MADAPNDPPLIMGRIEMGGAHQYAPPPKLHVMRETNLKDIPATLREIADSIERGDIGNATGCAVAVEADDFAVYYAGNGEAGPRVVLLLATAQAKIINGVLEVFDA